MREMSFPFLSHIRTSVTLIYKEIQRTRTNTRTHVEHLKNPLEHRFFPREDFDATMTWRPWRAAHGTWCWESGIYEHACTHTHTQTHTHTHTHIHTHTLGTPGLKKIAPLASAPVPRSCGWVYYIIYIYIYPIYLPSLSSLWSLTQTHFALSLSLSLPPFLYIYIYSIYILSLPPSLSLPLSIVKSEISWNQRYIVKSVMLDLNWLFMFMK